jgi:probable F420-dependent oxidoreductase
MTDGRCRIGVQFHPQHTTVDAIRAAARTVDEMGVDSIWVWDHFYPLYGPADGNHFEGWTLLAAIAADTSRAMVGTLVACNTYRNPDLHADMARTIDHISGGRAYLGIGAGWFERDYDEYGYDFSTAGSRLRDLEAGLQRMKARISRLSPPPIGKLPILVGGSGEKVTLRLVATYADAWNSFGPPESWAHKNAVLDRWCAEVGRDPAEIERTVLLNAPAELDRFDELLEVGCDHVIVGVGDPARIDHVERALALARG